MIIRFMQDVHKTNKAMQIVIHMPERGEKTKFLVTFLKFQLFQKCKIFSLH